MRRPLHWIIAAELILLLCMAVGVGVWYPPAPARAASQFATILCDNFQPINQTANAQIIAAGNANQFIYICSYNLATAATESISIVEGTGSVCGTGTLGMVGGPTAATGITFPAAGIVNFGGGTGAVTKTKVAGDNVCILVSSATQLSGVVGWTAAPF